MRTLLALLVTLNLLACAASLPSNDRTTASDTAYQKAPKTEPEAQSPAQPRKSPHGYIIDNEHEPGRFGGFVGDCADDQNWPYYWQCMSENSGDGGIK